MGFHRANGQVALRSCASSREHRIQGLLLLSRQGLKEDSDWPGTTCTSILLAHCSTTRSFRTMPSSARGRASGTGAESRILWLELTARLKTTALLKVRLELALSSLLRNRLSLTLLRCIFPVLVLNCEVSKAILYVCLGTIYFRHVVSKAHSTFFGDLDKNVFCHPPLRWCIHAPNLSPLCLFPGERNLNRIKT